MVGLTPVIDVLVDLHDISSIRHVHRVVDFSVSVMRTCITMITNHDLKSGIGSVTKE